jgi:Zn-dependent peptidase ImmA (M78 family)
MKINPHVKEILKKHQKNAPVSVGNIAKELGINVYAARLPKNVAGKLYRDERSNSGWAIKVNRNDPFTRQRFTVAHEIAHFLLHRHKIDDEVEDDTFYRSNLSGPIEAEANKFASNLLMPMDLISEIVSERGERNPQEIADELKVSETALRIRLGLPT